MKKCREAGCSGTRKGRGLCAKHYKRLRVSGQMGFSSADDARIAEALEWVMDGEPLTTPFERVLHEQLDLAA